MSPTLDPSKIKRTVFNLNSELPQNTNMVDFTIDVFHGLHPDEEPPEALHEKRSDVVRQLTELQEKSSQVIEMFSRKDVSCSILLKYSSSN